jgi:hypothetical protein
MADRPHLVGFCPHCCNRAPQELVLNHDAPIFFTEEGEPSDHTYSYYVAVCSTCGAVLLYGSIDHEIEASQFAQGDLLWPVTGLKHESIPKAVAECYEEATRIKNIAPNAFAGQARRVLEALCDERGVKSGVLQQRIAALAECGEIPPVLAEMSHVLRLLGNVGVHYSTQNVSPIDAEAIDDFLKAIVEYVYIARSKLHDFQTKMAREEEPETHPPS